MFVKHIQRICLTCVRQHVFASKYVKCSKTNITFSFLQFYLYYVRLVCTEQNMLKGNVLGQSTKSRVPNCNV